MTTEWSSRLVVRSRLSLGRFRPVLVVVVASVTLAASSAAARAATLPPIRVFPAAGEAAPPAAAISDRGAPDATCSGWYRQSDYVGQPTGAAWWEFSCHHEWPTIGTGATSANWGGQDIFDDYFYWDGSAPVGYGGWAFYGYWDGMIVAQECAYWTDQPSGATYGPLDESLHPIDCPAGATNAAPTASFTTSCDGLRCALDAGASVDSDGTITSYAWDFGDSTTGSGGGPTTTHTYQQTGTYAVRLTVTDNGGASATATKDVSVTNAAPTAFFTVACTALTCSFDSVGSVDSDGTIVDYSWMFGDGTSASGRTAAHTYSRAGSYTVTLTVTDNAGGHGDSSRHINPMSLSARGYKLREAQKVDLSWTDPGGASVDVYRDGVKIATVQASSYTDNLNRRGSGTYKYKVCAPAASTCSNEAKVSF